MKTLLTFALAAISLTLISCTSCPFCKKKAAANEACKDGKCEMKMETGVQKKM